ncbi:MAG: type III pantothenate kinase [Candidatus Margulisbacteria bacterium]|nr:type III pantothenate kinase [Candidatus Margulisiibacteriota bacterium]
MAQAKLSLNKPYYDTCTVDIGNSGLKTGYFLNNNLLKIKSVRSRSIKRFQLEPSKKIIVSSVVPEISKILKKKYKNAEFVNHEQLKIAGMTENIGIDRAINLFAAGKLYKEKSLCVIDFGTAITFTCSKNNSFVGGIICPGLDMMLAAINKKTAQLPLLNEINPQQDILQKKTEAAINSGIYHMVVISLQQMILKVQDQLGGNLLVVATGGNSLKFTEKIETIKIVNPTLLLEGLNLLANNK